MTPSDSRSDPAIDPQALVAAAIAAASHAHAPYSGFGVGAAVLLDDGRVLSGCNFENASYGLTLCAEAVALGTVNAQGGARQIAAIAIAGGPITDEGIRGSDPVFPCGRCRQLIHEVAQLSGRDLPLFCASADGTAVETTTIGTLLPHAFGPRDLGIA